MVEEAGPGGSQEAGAGGEAGDDKTVLTDGASVTDAQAAEAKAAEEAKAAAEVGGKTEEEKAAEAKAAEAKAAEEKGEEETGAPETYKDFTVPEGMEIDAATLIKFQDLAKKFDLSQEKAQELVDVQAEFMKGHQEEQQKAQLEVWANMRKGWLKDSKADEEIGGQKFDEKVEVAKKALTEFGTPALVELLETFGIGNHPEIIRFSSRIGAAIGEDRIITGRTGGQEKTLAQRIFTNQPS